MKRLQHFPLDPTMYPEASALFEALDGWKPAESRVRSGNIAAACLIVTGEAPTGRAAARAAGVSERNFYRFRAGKYGKLLFDKLDRLFREDAGRKAVARIVQLARQDKNLSVAMRANEWLAGLNGFVPIRKAEVEHKGLAPAGGMMVIHPDAVTPEALDQILPIRRGEAQGQ